MRRWTATFLIIAALALICGTTAFLFRRAQAPDMTYETASPELRDIIRKTVASGALVPRNEVAVKPRVSGVVDALAVEPGAVVEVGDLLAEIGVIPDSMSLNNATASLRAADISLADAERAHERDSGLFEQNALSAAALQQSEVRLQLRQQERRAAADTLRLIREGAARGGEDVNTQVRATIRGMVLDVPVKVGQSVIESNTFNEGTTVALVADMGDLIFQGSIDESEVSRVRVGMPLSITVGALEDEFFSGELEYIAPKGSIENGAVQFEVRAAIDTPQERFIRAGVSATADIELEKRAAVLSINEALLKFEDGSPYVEVEVSEQIFERRPVELGISDGIYTEVLSGVSADDQLKGRAR